MLIRFYNSNAASIRSVMVANCLCPELNTTQEVNNQQSSSSSSSNKDERGNPMSHRDIYSSSPSDNQPQEEPDILHHASSRLQLVKQFLIIVCNFFILFY